MNKRDTRAAIGLMLVVVAMLFLSAMVAWAQVGVPTPVTTAVAAAFVVVAWRTAGLLSAALDDETP